MYKNIFNNDNNEMLNYDDLLSYLKLFKILNPEFIDWGFDDITGGIDSFFEEDDYYKMKSCFESLFKNK